MLELQDSLLNVRGLKVSYRAGDGQDCIALSGLELQIRVGEITGIFGSSGCGKTSLGLALLNLLPQNAKCTAETIGFRGCDLQKLNEAKMRRIRGKEISVIYQEPALALNPVMRVGDQIAEVIRAHEQVSKKERSERVRDLLGRVRLDRRRGICEAFPHELSGGECHRILIAQAIACRPSLVIADEPTAGLDAELKPEIMELIEALRSELGVSFLLMSHDRKMLARVADRTLEMSGGRLQEARHETAQSLRPTEVIGIDQAREINPLIVLRGFSKSFSKRGLLISSWEPFPALRDVNLTIPRGSTFALVGPSGSGKSALAKCMALWETADAGQILFGGKDITCLSTRDLRRLRPKIQLIVQDSASALNPNLTAQEIVGEPLLIQGQSTKEQRDSEVKRLFKETGLEEAMLTRMVSEFSGGERQRLAIARALILKPEVIIFDESTTGLDRAIRQQIIALTQELKALHDLTYVVISHDLELVREIANYVAVMRGGTVISVCSVSRLASERMNSRENEAVLKEGA